MGDSWYVETLLRRREQVHSSIVSRVSTPFDVIEDVDLDNDDYNNLLLIEKTIQQLINDNKLTEREKKIITLIMEYQTFKVIAKETNLARYTVYKIFQNVCDRIAYILGGEFTNDGYLEKMEEKYHLSDEQLERAKLYMKSNIIVRNKSINGKEQV